MTRNRLDFIDAMRGFVIALMVLDHTRDFFHYSGFEGNPTDPDTTTVMLFVTRWVTHLCAPTFVFLAGVSIFIQKDRGKLHLGRFLATRGLWLIFLEVTFVGIGFNFGPTIFLQVIWAIGCGMLALSVLHVLPERVCLALALLIIGAHDLIPHEWWDVSPLMRMMFGAGDIGMVWVGYAAIPWLGIMLLGFALGRALASEPAERRMFLISRGTAFIALFVVLRFINRYGDPKPWGAREEGWRTVLSFFAVSKYPPSLLYVLATVGVSMLLMVLIERLPNRWFITFGRTPLFTYLCHIYLVHGAALVVGVLCGVPASAFFNSIQDPDRLIAAHWGFGLPVVYVVWAILLALLYPLSRWFMGVKARRNDWWLSYL